MFDKHRVHGRAFPLRRPLRTVYLLWLWRRVGAPEEMSMQESELLRQYLPEERLEAASSAVLTPQMAASGEAGVLAEANR